MTPRRIAAALAALLIAGMLPGSAAPKDWHSDKYSMFIHFGLYSKLGGVWDGKPVTQGYSEQIQSFAGIFSDWYALTADEFDPQGFDADSIVRLAKEAGMRSIVFTSKHHDGFCMFRTATTGYNSVDMTPSGRDYVRELSDACRRGGIKFGLYFSVIDWNYPYAYPISSHNADFVTPQHHELNKAQVTELLTYYGNISELWFDMGSQTPAQSRELYELVHRLQPDCMVSGRVGNDFYDFAVMADNKYPDGALHAPWQSAASMFNETWSYRSWQERGSVEDKADEKLRSLVNVVSHGGNFLLNIGPDDNGEVVPFEKEVLLRNGRWLKEHGEAVYGTDASPFGSDFSWGAVTRKGHTLYLILSGTYPEDRTIRLDMPGYKAVRCEDASFTQKGDRVEVRIPDGMKGIDVIRLDFNRVILPMAGSSVNNSSVLYSGNAQKEYSYSCFDYYSNYRSTVGYRWDFPERRVRKAVIEYTADEIGREITLYIGGVPRKITLEGNETASLERPFVSESALRYVHQRGSAFDSPSYREPFAAEEIEKMKLASDKVNRISSHCFQNVYAVREINADKDCYVLMDAGAGNGIEIFLNGESVMKHLNPYRCEYRNEPVLLHLRQGSNQVVMRAYNRFEDHISFNLGLSRDNTVYRTTVDIDSRISRLSVKAADTDSPHKDCGLHNLRILLR